MPKNDVDDSSSVVSNSTIGSQLSKKSSKAIPRCHCSWKNCRGWQKTFHSAHHKLFDGTVKVSWDKGDEQLKSKWDKFLKVEEAKRLGKRYYVARHHFPEGLIKEHLKNSASWDWSDKWTKEEAEKFYGFVPLSAASGDDSGLYYKLPLVPRDNVKEIIKKVRKETASTINEEEEMPPTTLNLPSSTSSAHGEKNRSSGRGKHSSSRQSRSLSPSRGGNDRRKKANDESLSFSPPVRNSGNKSLEPPRRPGSPVNGQNTIPKSPLLEPQSPISESVQNSSSLPPHVKSLSPPPRPGLGAESASGQSQMSRREVFDDDNVAKQIGKKHRASSDGLTVTKNEGDSPFDGSEKGRCGEDDSPFGTLNNTQEEEGKNSMEMIQIPASDYQALLAERDELRATAEEREVSINKLNEEISALKKDMKAYKERYENKNDKLDDLENKLDSVGVASKTLAIRGAGGNGNGKDSLAAIEYLKVENERLNQKAAYLFQRNQTYEKTIEEYEEQMTAICDAAVDREREMKKLLVRNPWQLIANTIFPSDDGE